MNEKSLDEWNILAVGDFCSRWIWGIEILWARLSTWSSGLVGLVVAYMISSSSKDSRIPRILAIVLVGISNYPCIPVRNCTEMEHLKWNCAAFVFFLQWVFFPDRRLPLVTMMLTWEMFQWCHFPCLVDLINLHHRHWIWNHLPMVLGPWPPILCIGENSSLKV